MQHLFLVRGSSVDKFSKFREIAIIAKSTFEVFVITGHSIVCISSNLLLVGIEAFDVDFPTPPRYFFLRKSPTQGKDINSFFGFGPLHVSVPCSF